MHVVLRRLLLVAISLGSCFGTTVLAQQTKAKKNLILPGEAFSIAGRTAFIMWPEEAKRSTPQPWVMYAPTLPGLPDRHEKWMHEQFLAAGVAVAGIDIGEAYGSPTGRKQFTALYNELTKNRGFSAKPCLLGRSRGGLWMSSWAIANPEKVAGIAGIYPVFDLRSYPGIKRAAPAYQMSADELQAKLSDYNPIQKSDVLAKAGIPVLIIHGDQDRVVPVEKNSAALHESYERAGSADRFRLLIAKGQGHNFWPGFFRSQPLIDFVIRQAKAPAPRRQPYIVAHRGLLRFAPENTLANFRACLELRLGFEFDVEETKDGRLVCIHDDTLDRTTNGVGKVADHTLAEIQKLDAGSWFSERFRGERVPTVEAVFALLAKHHKLDVLVAVDIKASGVESRLVKLARDHGVLDKLLFIGRTIGNPAVRTQLKDASPFAQTAAVANNAKEFKTALQASPGDWVYVRYLISAEQGKAVKAKRKRSFIAGATVSGPQLANWQTVSANGIDAILTDYPLQLRAALSQKDKR